MCETSTAPLLAATCSRPLASTDTTSAAQVYEPGAPDGDFLGQLDEQLDIQVTTLTDEECEFELKGVSAAIANALRRILISEVPSMAIETVFMHNNTSIIQDEVLSHR